MSYRDYKKQLERKKEEAKTINLIEKNIQTFSSRKNEYVEQAKDALKRGDKIAYKTASMMLKNVIFQIAQASDMLANFKAARDMREMGSLNVAFTKSMDKVIATLNKSNKKANFAKTREGFAKAMYNQTDASQQLKELLSSNGMAFSETVQTISDITDDDIKKTLEDDIKNEYKDTDALLDSLEDAFGDKDLSKDGQEKKEMLADGGEGAPNKKPTNSKKDEPFVKAEEPPKTKEEKGNNSSKEGKAEEPLKQGKEGEKPSSTDGKGKPTATDNVKNGKDNPESLVLNSGLGKESETYMFRWDDLPSITFDNVAGLEEAKLAVENEVILPLKHPESFEGYTIKKGGGLLLFGPPGTGKTMISAAIAHEVGAKFCEVKPSDLLHQGLGQSEKAVKALFDQARQFPCAVIYFDEMDSIAPKETRSQYSKHLRSEFLAQIQGMESYRKNNDNILFLIAATNKPWAIDSAFLRPGRFGTKIYVGLPDSDARRYLITKKLDEIRELGVVKIYDDIDVEQLVEKTAGFNCSDISYLFDKIQGKSGRRNALTQQEKYMDMADFDSAFETVKSSVRKEDIEKLMVWENNGG